MKQLTDQELFIYFKEVSSKAIITPFKNIQFKKYDTKNVKALKAYHRNIGSYISCIQELRKRGYTLLEVMDILQ